MSTATARSRRSSRGSRRNWACPRTSSSSSTLVSAFSKMLYRWRTSTSRRGLCWIWSCGRAGGARLLGCLKAVFEVLYGAGTSGRSAYRGGDSSAGISRRRRRGGRSSTPPARRRGGGSIVGVSGFDVGRGPPRFSLRHETSLKRPSVWSGFERHHEGTQHKESSVAKASMSQLITPIQTAALSSLKRCNAREFYSHKLSKGVPN